MVVTIREGASGIYWVETRAAAKHPRRQSTASSTKNYPDRSINSAEAERPCSIEVALVKVIDD